MRTIPKKPPKRIHVWALVGAATAAKLPIGLDAKALSAEEITMIINIGSMFGRSLTRSAAEGFFAANVATVVGQTAAFAAFEAANAGYPATIPIKASIAAGLIELVGHAAFESFRQEYEHDK